MADTVLRRNSITTRLTSLVAGALVAAVLVVGGAALFEQRRQLTNALESKAASLAQFVAQVSPLSIVSLNFIEMGNLVRKVVATDDDAVYAVIVNEQRIPLAYSIKDADSAVSAEARALWEGRSPLAAIAAMKKSARILEVEAPIRAGEKSIGTAIVGFSFERVRRALVIQVFIIGAILVVVTAVSLLLMEVALRRLLQPVKALTAAATQISAGNLHVELAGTERPDELGVLSRAFNSMAAQLSNLVTGMEQRLTELQRMGQALQGREEELRHNNERLLAEIEERKRTEEALRLSSERLQLATRVASIGIWDWDVVRNELVWDESMYQLYGIRRGDFGGAYDAWIRTIHPDDKAYTDGEIQAALRGEREYAPEFRIVRTDGSVRHIKADSHTIRDQAGKPLRMIGTNIDITERKRAEDELRSYKDQLEDTVQRRTAELLLARDAAEAANKAKSVFLANMSHELRTPLNAILGFSSLIRRDPQLSQGQRENIEIINRSGEHLLKLINDVLEIAKIEAGRVQLEIEPFDLGGLVRDVVDMMQLRAQEKGLRLQIDQSSEFPRYIRGDEARLRQILINLVGNAVKFTQEGGVVVRLGVRRNDMLHLLIEVEDSGPGISAEDQKRLFKPFIQLAEGGAQKGTGLGLAITRQFVDLMRGAISVASELGRGSVFRVDLPVEPVTAPSVPKVAARTHGEVVGLAAGQPQYRVLIAEDQPENQQLLVWLMSDIGIEARVADNGEQCVEVYREWQPDLIWMDRRMPVMEGEEATRRIRQLPGGDKVKIVAVTASAFKEEQQEMLDAGMDDFVRKPYRPDEIYDCLARQLNVKYRYGKEPGPAPTPTPLTAAMLLKLPEPLRRELREAVTSLDGDRIADMLDKVGAVDQEVARTLARLAEYFDYPAILAAIDKANC
ncbi:MAG: response regulator [Rhodocyclales bacterium]|nr:response regulator [Rhodocyclales bacterium]